MDAPPATPTLVTAVARKAGGGLILTSTDAFFCTVAPVASSAQGKRTQWLYIYIFREEDSRMHMPMCRGSTLANLGPFERSKRRDRRRKRLILSSRQLRA